MRTRGRVTNRSIEISVKIEAPKNTSEDIEVTMALVALQLGHQLYKGVEAIRNESFAMRRNVKK
jgi:hypothetical protein